MDTRNTWAYIAAVVVPLFFVANKLNEYYRVQPLRAPTEAFRVRTYKIRATDLPSWTEFPAKIGNARVFEVMCGSQHARLVYIAPNDVLIKKGQKIAVFDDGRSLEALRHKAQYTKAHLDRLLQVYTTEASAKGIANPSAYAHSAASVANAQNEYDKAVQELRSYESQMVFFAPYDGYVTISKVPVGSYVNHTQVIAQFVAAATDSVFADFIISQSEARHFKLHQKALFVPLDSGRAFEGFVGFIDPIAHESQYGRRVRVYLTTKDTDECYPGRSGTVKILTQHAKGGVVIPYACIATMKAVAGQPSVLKIFKKVGNTGSARYVQVQEEESHRGWVRVTGDLEVGDEVALDGPLAYRAVSVITEPQNLTGDVEDTDDDSDSDDDDDENTDNCDIDNEDDTDTYND